MSLLFAFNELQNQELQNPEFQEQELQNQAQNQEITKTDCKKCKENKIGKDILVDIEICPGAELAQAYVPFQHASNIFAPKESLIKGTVYPELFRPYNKCLSKKS